MEPGPEPAGGPARSSADAGDGADDDLDPWEAAQAEAAGRRRWPGELKVLVGLGAVVACFVLAGFLPGGAAVGFAVAAVLALGEIALSVALADGPGLRRRLDRLALHAPRRWWLHFPGAVLAGFALAFLARLSTDLVPSTGRSAIQTLVSFPSGMLSFAALAVVVPLAEEVFFRGFVYGTLERRSRVLAFAGAWLLFVAFHAPQTWGQWGALVGIAVTGLGLTSLRAVSGSTLVAATAHLVYNGLLALLALW